MTTQPTPIYDTSKLNHPVFDKFRDLLKYRHLIGNLVARDLKVRYKRSVIGFLWVMVNPLFTMGVLTLVFSGLFRNQIPHYSTYLLGGLLVWNMFSQGTVFAMTSMQGNAGTIRKIHVPAGVFVVASVGGAFINFVFSVIPFLLLAMLNGLIPQWSWLYIVVVGLQIVTMTLGIGFITAALIVYFSDVYEIYQVVLNMYFFLTPIMYPISILKGSPIEDGLLLFQHFNPMFYIVSGLRIAVLDGIFPAWEITLIGSVSALIVLVLGWLLFTAMEDNFAYLI